MSTQHATAPVAADRAYLHVKDRVLDGSYPGGQLLSEGQVAADLSMSRTPVREAFLRLQAEGFLRLYPKRGALVVPVTKAEAEAVLEARLVLESFAIDKLAALGPDVMRQVGAQMSEMPAARDGAIDPVHGRPHEADRAFHALLVAAAGNPIVSDLYDALRDRQLRLTAAIGTQRGRLDVVTHQHADIAALLVKGEVAEAKRRLRDHLAETLRVLGYVGGPLLAADD